MQSFRKTVRYRALFPDEVGSLAAGLVEDEKAGLLVVDHGGHPSVYRRHVRRFLDADDLSLFERIVSEWEITKARLRLRRAGMDV